MSLIRSLVPTRSASNLVRHRADETITLDQWASNFEFGRFPFMIGSLGEKEEEITQAYTSLLSVMSTNGPVYACEVVRLMLFSEARFLFRQRRSGHPGDLFGTEALRLLEKPDGIGSTTATMLKKAMVHADYGGTAFMVRRPSSAGGLRIVHPRPDWMTVLLGSYEDEDITAESIDVEIIGYQYHPGGYASGQRPKTFLPEEVATFTPVPDGIGKVRGVPWISAARRYVMSHNAATTHKLKFFENGATPQLTVSFENVTDPAKLRSWIEVIDQDHKGMLNAYKTLYLGAGAKPMVVGKDLQQLDFKATQGADETLIAAAAGVGPVVAQLSEGLQGSSLNAGNFGQAMRRVADITMRPLWRDMAGSLEVFIPPPPASELWYDDSDIPALKDDIKDRAEVVALHSTAIRTLADGGFAPDTVVDAIVAGDLSRLEHTGKLSVQLQTPGEQPATRPQLAAGVEPPLLTAGQIGPVRCPSCDKLVARAIGPGTDLDCPRCHAAITA